MSVIAEISLPAGSFPMGTAVMAASMCKLTLECLVPAGKKYVPYVWMVGDDDSIFEQHARANPAIRSLQAISRIDNSTLYQVAWAAPPRLLTIIEDAAGVILEAHCDSSWSFRLRFATRGRLTDFFTACSNGALEVRLNRVYASAEKATQRQAVSLTPRQYEALDLALRQGYFNTPKEATLDELAIELDISKQAISKRLRKANETVLRHVPLMAMDSTS